MTNSNFSIAQLYSIANKLNKLYSLFFAVLFLGLTAITSAQNDGAPVPDAFPKNTVWVNSEYQIFLSNLKEKIAVVVVADENCVECGYYLSSLQATMFRFPQVQLLQVIKGDPAAPVSKNHLLQYIQKNRYTHPIGVLPDLSGFHNAKIETTPYFLLYEKSDVPSLVASGQDGFAQINKRLEQIKEDQQLMAACSVYQLRTAIEPTWWANPVIETPTYIAYQEGGDGIFVNDAAHHRIIEMDGSGNVVRLIGSTRPGYTDESMFTSSFNNPYGMVEGNGKLFIADTYNNRVRVVDFTTEQVTTLVGNGYITWKKAKAIDSKFEPLGLPVDVAILGNQLYVASASMNQIFEVDMSDGATRLLCDLPESKSGLLRNCPVNLNSGVNELFVTMADGQAFKISRKGKISPLMKKDDHKFKSVCHWKEGIAGITPDGHVLYLNVKEEKWTTVGEHKVDGVTKNLIKLNHPTDMMNNGGDLVITDTDNHFIREVGSPSDKLMKNYWFKVSQDLIGYEPAHTLGDVVLMDTVFIATGDVKMNVLLDLDGYEIEKDGQNEILMNELTGKAKMVGEGVKDNSFTFKVQSDFPDGDIYIEVYLTMEHPENPGLYVVKRAYLDFPVFKQDTADELQEQIFKPNMLPY